MTLVVAFTLSAAGAVDGAHILEVTGVTQRHILGVEASPSSRPPVIGPVGADGTEVFFVIVISLEEEDQKMQEK